MENGITHTTRSANEYFKKLQYGANNFKKLEKKVGIIEKRIEQLTTHLNDEHTGMIKLLKELEQSIKQFKELAQSIKKKGG